MSDDFNATGKFRSLSGAARTIERLLVFCLTLVAAAWAGEVHVLLNLMFFKEQFLGFFFALGMAGVFRRVRCAAGSPAGGVPWFVWLCFPAGLVTGGYITMM